MQLFQICGELTIDRGRYTSWFEYNFKPVMEFGVENDTITKAIKIWKYGNKSSLMNKFFHLNICGVIITMRNRSKRLRKKPKTPQIENLLSVKLDKLHKSQQSLPPLPNIDICRGHILFVEPYLGAPNY